LSGEHFAGLADFNVGVVLVQLEVFLWHLVEFEHFFEVDLLALLFLDELRIRKLVTI
jgi:hypothetical protein